MRRKLIALDLDGTTLNQAGQLSRKTKRVLQNAQAAGHLVVISTGRPDSIAEPFYDELGLTGPMINFNGALIHRPHQAWAGERQRSISVRTALALRQFKQRFLIKLMVAEGKQLLVADHSFSGVPFLPDLPHPGRLLDETGLTKPPISVTMFITAKTLVALQQAIVSQFPQLAPKTWGAWSGENTALEVTAGATSKGAALKYVAARYHIAQRDIVAFGDDMNDFDMLMFAGHGVAMANARREIKTVANAVTRVDNDEDGVANYLVNYLAL